MNINALVRSNMKTFKPYKPAEVPLGKVVKLDSGENQYVESLQKKSLEEINFYTYPDPFCEKLRQKIGEYVGLDKSWIVCGNGSDELIDLLTRVFVEKNDEIIINPPTFPMYEFYGNLQEAKIIPIVRKENLSIDEEKIQKSISPKTKIVWIDTPGNPTSVVTSNETVEGLLKKNVIIVSDEAYFEYANKSTISLLKKYPNLVILRTFSKWAGLAGLRIGYAIANPEIIKFITSIKAPYNVNSVAQEMACRVLDKRNIFLKNLQRLILERKKIIKKLIKIPQLNVLPSDGAYIIFKPGGSAENLQKYLKKNGFLVKVIKQPQLEGYIRINLMEKKEGTALIRLIRRYYEKISF